MIKGSIQQEVTTLVYIYASNVEAPKYIKQILTDRKGEINSNTVIVGTLTPYCYQWIDLPEKKISKETRALSGTLGQM